MSNKRINKAYVRYDGTGRVIPGSLILNRFKPAVGNWKETPAYECCNVSGITLYTAPLDSYPINNVAVRILCDDVEVDYVYSDDDDAANLTALINILNGNPLYTQFGVYSDGGDGDVKLVMPAPIASSICPTGTLSFEILGD